MRLAFRYLLVMSLTVSLLSCESDDEQTPESVENTGTIADALRDDSQYVDLVVALNRASLLEGLDGSDPYTFFAPSDEVLAAYLLESGGNSLFEIPEETLRILLLNHMVAGSIVSDEQEPGYLESQARYPETTIPIQIFYDPMADGIVNDSVQVNQANEVQSNGVLHRIDRLIETTSMADLIYANPDLSTFRDALELAGINGPNYRGTLDNRFEPENTAFAPTNEAFAQALEVLGFESLEDVPVSVLRRILNMHIVREVMVRSENLDNETPVETLNGETVTLTPDGIVDASGASADFVLADIQAGNGVVHILDKVLLPETIAIEIEPTVTGLAQTRPDLSLFYEALTLTGLDSFFDQIDADFTVFMPSNFVINFYLDGQDLEDVPVNELEQLLLNHALNGSIQADDFNTSWTQSLAISNTSGTPVSMYIDPDGENGITINGMAFLQETDIPVTNGVVHMVHRIITVPTVYTTVEFNPILAALHEAMDVDGLPAYDFLLNTDYDDSPAPFTLFAPRNSAFQSLLNELELDELSQIPTADLAQALNTHAVSGQNITEDLLLSGPLTTLGEEITVDTTNGTLTDLNGRTATITFTDIQTDNGVVHIIDRVLLGEQ